MATNGAMSFALDEDGTVWMWGINKNFRGVSHDPPFKIAGLSGVKAISVDGSCVLFLKDDGTVWSAGDNTYGQVGDGTTEFRSDIAQVKGITGIVAIDTARYTSMALNGDGKVFVWGKYPYGGGDGKVTAPMVVPGLSDIKAIGLSDDHYLAVDKDGNVWAWGNNRGGELGIGDEVDEKSTPAKVSGISGVKAVAAGEGYSLVVKEDGTLWSWGTGASLGQGPDKSYSPTPAMVPVSNTAAVDASTVSATALGTDGTIYVWGLTNPGARGMSVGEFIYTPEPLPYMKNSKAMAAKSRQTLLAVNQNGTVWGIGTLFYKGPEAEFMINSTLPVQIKFVASAQPPAGPSQASSSTAGKQTPAMPILAAAGIFVLAATLRSRKK